MAKFGKKYRKLQIEEWKSYYINYKTLKHKIKLIKQKIDSNSRNGTLNLGNRSIMPSLNIIPINRTTSLLLDDLSILYTRKYGPDLKEFIDLLDEELNKCYLFYIKIEKEIYYKVNSHLYTQTNYINYNLFEIYNEMCKLNKTVYLIKCLNSFINENMNALKNILKKFDNKLSIYCGKIQTKYILKQLTLTENNKLEYLLQYKIIDESLTICESNLEELSKYFLNQNSISRKVTLEFEHIKNENTNTNKDNQKNSENENKEILINNNEIITDIKNIKNSENLDMEGLNKNKRNIKLYGRNR